MPKSNKSNPSRAISPAGQLAAQGKSNAKLDKLKQRFEAFRRKHSPGSRIPVALQKAVVAAIGDGITRSVVEKACRVSWTQTQRWLAEHGPHGSSGEEVAVEAARVFSVVDDGHGPQSEPAQWDDGQELQLRLGGWSVCVRRIDG